MSKFSDVSNTNPCCCLPQLGLLEGALNERIYLLINSASYFLNGFDPVDITIKQYVINFNTILDTVYLLILFVNYLIYNKLRLNPNKCSILCDKKSDDCEMINLINQFSISSLVIIESTLLELEDLDNFELQILNNYINFLIREIYNSYYLLVQQLPNPDKYYVDIDKLMRINRTGLRFVPVKCFIELDLNTLILTQLNDRLLSLQGPISYGGDPTLYYLQVVNF